MKVLWITNNVMPYPAKYLGIKASNLGGWILSMLDEISRYEDIELAIATVCDCKKVVDIRDNNIRYFLIPGKLGYKYDKSLEYYWKEIDKVFSADIVHLFGSEFGHGLAYLNATTNKISVLNIQGLVSMCGNEFLGGIDKDQIRKYITIRDIIKHDTLIDCQKKYLKRGKMEYEIIRKVDYAIGRTSWDYNNVSLINQNIKYLTNNESLRKKFYEKKWDINNINKYTIYVSQASQPLKGFHILLEALNVVKKFYPDVVVKVGGYNVTDTSTLKNKLKLSGYGKYLKHLINKYELNKNVIFLGDLNEEKVIENMLLSNVFVLPSKIENSSNSLGESMLLGLPSIAAYTGGTPDMIEHNKEGLLYSFSDYNILAKYIMNLFENKDLCVKLSENSRKRALERHDLKKNLNQLHKIYEDIIDGK